MRRASFATRIHGMKRQAYESLERGSDNVSISCLNFGFESRDAKRVAEAIAESGMFGSVRAQGFMGYIKFTKKAQP